VRGLRCWQFRLDHDAITGGEVGNLGNRQRPIAPRYSDLEIRAREVKGCRLGEAQRSETQQTGNDEGLP
jgi:hypothetical protein